jgi:hypothetical protein
MEKMKGSKNEESITKLRRGNGLKGDGKEGVGWAEGIGELKMGKGNERRGTWP